VHSIYNKALVIHDKTCCITLCSSIQSYIISKACELLTFLAKMLGWLIKTRDLPGMVIPSPKK
jgi:hypothetical protein